MPDIVLHCTPGGSFESNCTTKANGKKSCFCLNPNDGKPDHATPVELAETEEKPNCGKFYLYCISSVMRKPDLGVSD